MRFAALLAAGVILLSSGCLGGRGAADVRRPSSAELTRQVEARRLNAVGFSMHGLTCSIWRRRALTCAGTLREAGENQIGHAYHTRLRFAFYLRRSGQLGAPYCPIDVLAHEGNPYC